MFESVCYEHYALKDIPKNTGNPNFHEKLTIGMEFSQH